MNVISGYRLPNYPDNGRTDVESVHVGRREAGNYKNIEELDYFWSATKATKELFGFFDGIEWTKNKT